MLHDKISSELLVRLPSAQNRRWVHPLKIQKGVVSLMWIRCPIDLKARLNQDMNRANCGHRLFQLPCQNDHLLLAF
jgi:hypothetical protein